jgi:hypothetical protein
MTFEERLSKLFGLNDKTWLNHATAESVISRGLIPPMITIAALSRIWIGTWWLALLGLIIIWTFLNTRIFPKAKSYDNWYARGAFGERVYAARKKVPIPAHHESFAKKLKVLNAVHSIIWIYGLVILNYELAITGTLLQLTAKFWFIDRMVWLYNDMHEHPEYSNLKAIVEGEIPD